MSELSFLIDLLLNHKLPKITKDLIAARIIQIEEEIHDYPPSNQLLPINLQTNLQSASTLAAMARNGFQEVTPIEVAQTPATAAAMESRNQAIKESLAGKVDKITGRPRKF